MSILTFLLFTSVVYFAMADPIAESTSASDQDQINKFMISMEKLYDEEFAPLLKRDLSEEDCTYMKTMALDGMAGFINYCLLRAKQQADDESNKPIDGDIVMEFDAEKSLYSAAYRQPQACI